MNPDEKSKNDISAQAEGPADLQNGSEPASSQAVEGPACDETEYGEEKGACEGSAEEPESAEKAGGRSRAEGSKLKSIVEALVFLSEQPISLDRIASVLNDCSRKELKEILKELEEEYEQRAGALQIVEVANGYQFRTRPEFAPWIGKLRQQRFARLSRAALETLAIVAYRQPVTRAEAESIRGVDSGAVLGTLLERRLLRILGRKEVPGRPILYGTTQEFLELFGLKSLKDLPTLREIKDMVDTSRERAEGEEGEIKPEEGAPQEERVEQDEQVEQVAGEGPVPSDGEEAFESDEEGAGWETGEPSDLEGEWAEEEPAGEEEITPQELDEILKTTKTRLEIYEADLQEEEAGRTEPARETDESEKPGQGGDPDPG